MKKETIIFEVVNGRIYYGDGRGNFPSAEYNDSKCEDALDDIQKAIAREISLREEAEFSAQREFLLQLGFQNGQFALLLGAFRMQYNLVGSFIYNHDAESGKKISDIQLRTRS